MSTKTWYVDSSVLLRALLGDSPAALAWLHECRGNGDRLVGSMLLDIEVRRVVRILGIPDAKADSYLDKFYFEPIDDVVHRKALAIPFHLSGADSIHVATAERLGKDFITLVTHDAQMAAAARSLGMEVLDPVTDDPKRPPV